MIFFFGVIICIILFYVYRLFSFMKRLGERKILPVTEKDYVSLRKMPQSELKPATVAGQKLEITLYIGMLSFVIIGGWLLWKLQGLSFSFLLLMIPLFNLPYLMNVFAITESGILSGMRYLPWCRMKGYEFVRIDVNHKYYGHSNEVNDQYELRIHSRFKTITCIVVSEEMMKKLIAILEERAINLKQNDAKGKIAW